MIFELYEPAETTEREASIVELMLYDRANILANYESLITAGIKNYDIVGMKDEDFVDNTYSNRACQSGELDANEFSIEISWGNQPYMFRVVSLYLGYT